MSRKIIDVSNGMKRIRYPDAGTSGGLGPCTAIGVLDPGIWTPEQRTGYLFHDFDFSCPHFDYGYLDDVMQEISQKSSDPLKLQAYATGGGLVAPTKNSKWRRRHRQIVERVLKKYFQDSQVQIKWAPDGYWTELILETLTEEFRLNKGRRSDWNKIRA